MAAISSNIGPNQERIFQLLRTGQELTKQDIAKLLHLSMPTTLQNVHDLIQAGILEEGGSSESTGGRKAKKIRLNRTSGFGVGIDIALHQVHFVVTDLLGDALCSASERLKFQDEPDWYQELGAALECFLQSNGIPSDKILGVGISFPGIIDEQGGWIVRSHIFGLEHVSLDRFRKHIPYPIVVSNDANCAAFAELSSEHRDYLYVSLNESVGGALMLQGKVLMGDTWQAGEIGHMLLIPGGTTCYCGKRGCADAYLSPKVLTGGRQSLRTFFRSVKAGEPEARAAWDVYLEYLAIFVTNL
ncbi:MAG: ROK family transcriptional regulator, partial [Butyricicoccaceae bacterium]